MTVTELLLRHDFVAFSARLHLIIDGHLLLALHTYRLTFWHCRTGSLRQEPRFRRRTPFCVSPTWPQRAPCSSRPSRPRLWSPSSLFWKKQKSSKSAKSSVATNLIGRERSITLYHGESWLKDWFMKRKSKKKIHRIEFYCISSHFV